MKYLILGCVSLFFIILLWPVDMPESKNIDMTSSTRKDWGGQYANTVPYCERWITEKTETSARHYKPYCQV